MSNPIVLWNAHRRASTVVDDAGITIKRYVLAPPSLRAPSTQRVLDTVHCGTVPPLALFCIVALAPYTDQLHALGAPRIPYRDLLLPEVLSDPRVWVTIAQVMYPAPVHSHDIDLSLSDTHLPLLQQIPSAPNFTLISLLSLPGCTHVSDDTVSELRRLNTLIALDLRATHLTTYGVTVLSRGLSLTRDDSGLYKKAGPWGLRILSLHGCAKVTDTVLPVLKTFPLLSAIGK
ncbi:hypothetical protein EDD17DRAFT_1469341 [Pisolithus thermaeus]|nr:hypothetical protein EDD17DRAFT_1469341 [Pisolithus thermaeus]